MTTNDVVESSDPAQSAQAVTHSKPTALIRLDGLSVNSDDGRELLHEINLAIPRGQLVTLLGPSGAGKTTLLRTIAGFTRVSAGSLHLAGRDATVMPPRKRHIGMVVQNYGLFPHMNVVDNIAYGMRARGMKRDTIAPRVDELLDMVQMRGFENRYPSELSGGQQQRVGIARAVANNPDVLLLDEPLSALDPSLRSQMIDEIRGLHERLNELTMVYVTHDRTEALTIADRILLLRDGTIVADGTPDDLYNRPPDEFAASFLGDANLWPVSVLPSAQVRINVAHRVITMAVDTVPTGLPSGSSAVLCVRPQHVELLDHPEDTAFAMHINHVRWNGETRTVVGDAGSLTIRAVISSEQQRPQIGQIMWVRPRAAVTAAGGFPSRSDITVSSQQATDLAALMEGVDVIYPDWDTINDNLDSIITEWNNATGTL